MYFILLPLSKWKCDPFAIVYGYVIKQWYAMFIDLYSYASCPLLKTNRENHATYKINFPPKGLFMCELVKVTKSNV